jgi:hypothetical protein
VDGSGGGRHCDLEPTSASSPRCCIGQRRPEGHSPAIDLDGHGGRLRISQLRTLVVGPVRLRMVPRRWRYRLDARRLVRPHQQDGTGLSQFPLFSGNGVVATPEDGGAVLPRGVRTPGRLRPHADLVSPAAPQPARRRASLRLSCGLNGRRQTRTASQRNRCATLNRSTARSVPYSESAAESAGNSQSSSYTVTYR